MDGLACQPAITSSKQPVYTHCWIQLGTCTLPKLLLVLFESCAAVYQIFGLTIQRHNFSVLISLLGINLYQFRFNINKYVAHQAQMRRNNAITMLLSRLTHHFIKTLHATSTHPTPSISRWIVRCEESQWQSWSSVSICQWWRQRLCWLSNGDRRRLFKSLLESNRLVNNFNSFVFTRFYFFQYLRKSSRTRRWWMVRCHRKERSYKRP